MKAQKGDWVGVLILSLLIVAAAGVAAYFLIGDSRPSAPAMSLPPVATSLTTTTLVLDAEAESFCWGWANGIWVGQGVINEMKDPDTPAAPPPQAAWDETYAACLQTKGLRAALKPQEIDLELRSEIDGRTHPALVCVGYVTGLRDVHRAEGLEVQYGPLPPADLVETYDACMDFNYWEREPYVQDESASGGGPSRPR